MKEWHTLIINWRSVGESIRKIQSDNVSAEIVSVDRFGDSYVIIWKE